MDVRLLGWDCDVLIYEQKFKHDMAGKESGSAKWNDTVEEFNEGHNEPFGKKHIIGRVERLRKT